MILLLSAPERSITVPLPALMREYTPGFHTHCTLASSFRGDNSSVGLDADATEERFVKVVGLSSISSEPGGVS